MSAKLHSFKVAEQARQLMAAQRAKGLQLRSALQVGELNQKLLAKAKALHEKLLGPPKSTANFESEVRPLAYARACMRPHGPFCLNLLQGRSQGKGKRAWNDKEWENSGPRGGKAWKSWDKGWSTNAKCFECQERGHVAKNCPNRRSSKKGGRA